MVLLASYYAVMRVKATKKIANQVPSLAELEESVSFITDMVLRENIVLTLQHVYFIVSVIDGVEVEGTSIANGLYKDLIVHSAAVIEGCLHHCLREHIDWGIIDSGRVMGMHSGYKDEKRLHKKSNGEVVCAVTKYKKRIKLSSNTQFIDVHRACYKAGIITKKQEEKVNRIRDERNKIHLAGLRSVDNQYRKNDARRSIKLAVEIIERVRTKLSNSL